MSVYKYSRYKIVIDPQSKKTQGLQTGDVVRRQYFDSPDLIYSLMLVLETGKDIIQGAESSYFIGALLEGDEPKNGELLDFVRVTNLFKVDRGGALYLTSSDDESPFMDVIDGIAVEKSLCLPYMGGGLPDVPDRNRYARMGKKYLTEVYKERELDVERIYRVTRKAGSMENEVLGIRQSFSDCPEYPARLLVSYFTRASKPGSDIGVSLGYTNGEETDGRDTISVSSGWDYQLQMVTVDFPVRYQRSFTIDLTSFLEREGDWFEIAELNIIPLADIATFSLGSKVRIGKVTGIVDPVFGVLDGMGAYFQNMYATGNVNVAGTLTAGDENGFASTFYVGKIHKNVILNSIDCAFEHDIRVIVERSPVGIGNVWRMQENVKLIAQTWTWRKEHVGERYCFSFWALAPEDVTLSLFQDDHFIGEVLVDSRDWKRYTVGFVVKDDWGVDLCFRMENGNSGMKFSAPQLEAGVRASQYQPTDERLSYTGDYGAWFSQGGIGGTIQNPLLRLNEDGSISSRDGSFVIRKDGTGYFADGRFEWSKDEISLRDVTIKWKDLDDEGKDQLYPVTVEIRSKSGLVVKNEDGDIEVRAVLFRNGEEIDLDGSGFEYRWKLWDASGIKVLKEYWGKEVVIDKGEFVDKGVLSYEISQ